jgi:uncharacterized GH25 family protein
MKRTIPVLLLVVLGVILYFFFATKETPTKKNLLTQQEPASTSQKAKQKSSPTQRVNSQNMQNAIGADFEDDPIGALQLDGQVVDEEGKGLEGALVGISSSPPRQTVSGKNGVFSFDKLVGRTYYLDGHKGELTGSASLVLNEEALPVTIRMQRGSSAEITVLDEVERKPIPNAEITWGWMTQLSVTTNEKGKALVQGLDSWALLSVRAEGYNPNTADVQPSSVAGSITKKTVLMAKGAPVSGVVLDPEGKPVSGARIDGQGDQGWGGSFDDDFHKIISDEQGRWMIPAVAAGTYRFSARSDTFAMGYSEPTILDGKTAVDGVIIRVEPSGLLTGKVVTADGAPVVGAVVRAREDKDSRRGESRRAYSDTEGKFTIKGLPKAPLVVGATSVDSNLATPVKADLTNGNAEVTLTIDITGTISGMVVDLQGNPIADAQVRSLPVNSMKDNKKWQMMRPRGTNSDVDGRFEIKGVLAGEEFSMSADFTGMSFGASWRDKDAQVIAKAGDTGVRLVLKPLSKIKGKVQFADGSVPKEFSVEVGYESKGNFTDAEGGSFELEKVNPGKQTAELSGSSFIYKRSKQFEAKPGETTDIGTIIVASGRVVQGRVLVDGQPVENATVVIGGYVGGSGARLDGEQDYNQKNRTLTNAEGLFTLKGLESDDELTAIAEHPTKGRSKPVKIEKNIGDATVELSLLAGGSVEGLVTRAGKPYPGRVQSRDMERSGSSFNTNVGVDGKFRFDFLTAGTYELTASGEWSMSKNSAIKTVSVTIEVGKTKKVSIVIPVGILLTVNPMRDGKLIERASLTMVKQSLNLKNTNELDELLKPMPRDQVINGYTFTTPGSTVSPMIFSDVVPGEYTLCVYQSPEEDVYDNMSDEEKKAPSPIFCQPHTITNTPSEQTITVEVPAGY